MKFGIIRPSIRDTRIVDCASLPAALKFAELTGGVDHGIVVTPQTHRVGIVVYEFGLFVPPKEQSYFAINGHLYAGNAVLYGLDSGGNTVDLLGMPEVFFLQNAQAIERSIALGLLMRPYESVNGEKTWQWPEPRKIPR